MKDNEIYSDDELELFKSLESDIDNGTYKPLDKKELDIKKAFFSKIATNTIKKKSKKKSLNIRLFEDDIEKLKAIALSEGMLYQTYLSSLVHKIVSGQLKAV
jgi:predicted DNA binding CopG/RHH family protein